MEVLKNIASEENGDRLKNVIVKKGDATYNIFLYKSVVYTRERLGRQVEKNERRSIIEGLKPRCFGNL